MELKILNRILDTDNDPILVVEDEPDICDLLVAAFEDINRNVIAVQNGREAQKLINNKKFSALIFDVVVPGANGIQLATMARISHLNKNAPIFLESGNIDLEIIKMAKSLKIAHILVKPFRYDDLTERVNQAIMANQRNEPKSNSINYAQVNSQKNRYKSSAPQKKIPSKTKEATPNPLSIDLEIED
jgi:DNA-binding response OmpR family regulator